MEEISRLKAEMARRQLCTALYLFLNDLDPVSVHCLACGGAELSDFLATTADKGSFVQHALQTTPKLRVGELVSLRNKYWNAMKHAASRDGSVRDDRALLAAFDDERNDHVLFIAWHDYVSAMGNLPIEAQVFQAWYFAKHPEKLADGLSPNRYLDLFPHLTQFDRREQKRRMVEVIDWAKTQIDIMTDQRTDPRPLLVAC